MLQLNDFKCEACEFVHESLEESGVNTIECISCGGQSNKFITKSTPVGCDSFNPHYDEQLGQHFKSASEKKSFLKSTGRSQESGTLSPRRTGKGRYLCSEGQSKKTFGKNTAWKKPNTRGL